MRFSSGTYKTKTKSNRGWRISSLFIRAKNRLHHRKKTASSASSVKKLFTMFGFLGDLTRSVFLSKGLIGLLGLAIVGFSLHKVVRFLSTNHRFSIQQIHINPTKHISKETLASISSDLVGKNLFLAPIEHVRDVLLQNPLIEDVFIVRTLPHEVEINVKEKEPVAILWLDFPYLVDSTGNLIKRVDSVEHYNLPFILGLSRSSFIADPNWSIQVLAQVVGIIDIAQKRVGTILRHLELDVLYYPYVTLKGDGGKSITLEYQNIARFEVDLKRIDVFLQKQKITDFKELIMFITDKGFRIHLIR